MSREEERPEAAGAFRMPELGTVRPFLEESHLSLVSSLELFVERRIAPLAAPQDDDEGRRQARRILASLGEGGWCRYAAPGDGGAVDLRACCLIREALAAASPLADSVFALQCLGAGPIVLGGDEGQRRRWLPGIADGTVMAAFAMTEPEAGSDVAAMATRARRAEDGEDGWVIDGRKTLITNAGIADLYSLFAVTGRREDGRPELSCFLVPADSDGLRFAGPQVLSAPHPLGEIVLEGCRVPDEALLGDPGSGFRQGLGTLDRLRATVAAAACGMAARALAEALSHARRRRQFGRPLAEQQLVQQKLARMASELDAARLLTYRAAHRADGGAGRVTLESAMAKAFATEAAQRIVDDAVQIHGGRGVLAASPVDHLYRAVRALRIYEGATEIQQLVIARELLRRED